MWWAIWLLLALLPNNGEWSVVVILMLSGFWLAAAVAIKPFVKYIQYIRALDSDMTYLNAPELNWIAECSDSVYNTNHDDLMT